MTELTEWTEPMWPSMTNQKQASNHATAIYQVSISGSQGDTNFSHDVSVYVTWQPITALHCGTSSPQLSIRSLLRRLTQTWILSGSLTDQTRNESPVVALVPHRQLIHWLHGHFAGVSPMTEKCREVEVTSVAWMGDFFVLRVEKRLFYIPAQLKTRNVVWKEKWRGRGRSDFSQ